MAIKFIVLLSSSVLRVFIGVAISKFCLSKKQLVNTLTEDNAKQNSVVPNFFAYVFKSPPVKLSSTLVFFSSEYV